MHEVLPIHMKKGTRKQNKLPKEEIRTMYKRKYIDSVETRNRKNA